ncbi:MAG: dihydrofolate reductase [Saprospiraceae bacterium]
MIISAIVALNADRIIGFENQIPWYLSADLKYFKKVTLNHTVLMGRKCYQSIGIPLPKRTNIIVTRDPFFIVSNCFIVHSIEEGILFAKKHGEQELFIIGGGEIYKQSMHLWNKLYITLVDFPCKGDTYFPEIDKEQWSLFSREDHEKDEKNNMNYSFLIYEKK